MIHTLPTLYQYMQSRHPDLTFQFRHLRAYCSEEITPETRFLNRGYNSLKWLIYALRTEIHPGELQDMAFHLLTEAAALDREPFLYSDVKSFRTVKHYKRMIPKPHFNIDDWERLEIADQLVLVNPTTQNITNLVFRDDWADIILVRNPTGAGAFIFSRNTAKSQGDAFNHIKTYLTKNRHHEHWVFPGTGDNLAICGGVKAPQHTTDITLDEMISTLEHALSL